MIMCSGFVKTGAEQDFLLNLAPYDCRQNEKERRPAQAAFLLTFLATYTNSTFSACHPLGPLTTVNVTGWPSFKLRNPFA